MSSKIKNSDGGNTIQTESTLDEELDYILKALQQPLIDLVSLDNQKEDRFIFKESIDKFDFSEKDLSSIKICNWNYEKIYDLSLDSVQSLDYCRYPDGTNGGLIRLEVNKIPTSLLRELVLKDNIIRFVLLFDNEEVFDTLSLSFGYTYTTKYEYIAYDGNYLIICSDYINPIINYGIQATKYEHIN